MTLNWKTKRKKKTSQQNTSHSTRTAPHPRTDDAASRGSNVRNQWTGCRVAASSPRSIHYYGTVQTNEVADRASLCWKVPWLRPLVLLIAVLWQVTGKISALCRAGKLKLLVTERHTAGFSGCCGRPTRHALSCFSSVSQQVLRWFPRFQVATACLSCSPHKNCPLSLKPLNYLLPHNSL
jgi:hypothetical protein